MALKSTYRALLSAVLFFTIILTSGCGVSSSSPEKETQATPAIAFTDVTTSAGLDDFRHVTGAEGEKYFPEAMGSGAALIDYNNDGWDDMVLVGGGTWPESDQPSPPALWLYRNNGDMTFSLANQEAGLDGLSAYGFGLAVADYDNDGDEDLYFTTLGPNLLLENRGGVFFDVAGAASLQAGNTWSTAPVFFDADRDGWVDLYVGNYVSWSPEEDILCTLDGVTKSYCTPELYTGLPSRFYHNNGDGTFSDWTERAGFLPAPGKMLGALEFDYNKDGWPDLAVASDTQPDLLYKNNGDGTFSEIGAISGFAYDENGRARAGMGIDAGVVDSTGNETLFVGNFSKEMIAVFRYIGDDLFVDRAAASKIGRTSLMTLTFGLFLFDVDLDKDLDLFAANGHVQQEIESTQDGITYRQPPHLFLNDGSGSFSDVAPDLSGVWTQPLAARGAIYGDLDHDGDLDILITENGGKAHLWRNDQTFNHNWIRVAVEGTKSNRSGLGTRVEACAGNQCIERWIRSGASFLSQSESTATIGLGNTSRIDSLVIHWPGGSRQIFKEVPINTHLFAREGAPHLNIEPQQGSP